MSETVLSQAAKLGFGLMRLPTVNGEIDIDVSAEMVDIFLEGGFSYFDTAYAYSGSEAAASRFLVNRYPRSAFQIATKLPGAVASKEDNKRVFCESLDRLQCGYFDFYLLHNVGKARIAHYDQCESWDFCRRMKQEGLIRHLGFSMHDTPENLDMVLTKNPDVDFVQLQINFIDWEDAALQSRALYEVARRHNTPVIIMEPVKGGMLAALSEKYAPQLADIDPQATPVSMALRFCASLEGVPVILSGMSTPEQVRQNVETFRNMQLLSAAQRQKLVEMAQALRAESGLGCTNCRYCVKDCPAGLNIPEYIRTFNDYRAFPASERVKGHYRFVIKNNAPASACIACGQCESVCPQRLPIIETMREVAEAMGE